jgi:putative exosortase-associated protein (TIGR04073 family)
MRNIFFFLSVMSVATLLTSGCAGPEAKLGRGVSNVYEVARLGELRRSVEQSAVFDDNYTVGFVRGFDRSVARTGLGVYEVVTFPLPPYHPIFTKYLSPAPVYPDQYTPGLMNDPLFATDTYVGYSGGDVAPFVPGSRFMVFDHNP